MNMSPLKAIRLKCLDCSGESSKEVELCNLNRCSLYPFRFGKRTSSVKKDVDLSYVPEVVKSKRIMTDEHKAKLREGLRKARESKKSKESTC